MISGGVVMDGKLVTVFGGSGFVGRYAVQALLKAGARVRIAERNPKRGWFLKAQGNLGQVQFMAADVTLPDSVARAVTGADAVVNLVGSFANMDAVQHQGAVNVARASAGTGVGALVQMSAIGADPGSPSRYGRSKGEGEAAVLAAFPRATILRPSIIFGREDAFVNRFAGMIKMLPVLPVIRGEAKFQPVFVGDVARAVVAALDGGAVHGGKTYELGGPEVLSMMQLNLWIASAISRKPLFVPLPDMAAAAMARLTGWLPGAPMSWDQWLMLQADNVVGSAGNGLAVFGIEPTPLEAAAPGWLVIYKQHGRFGVEKAT
jgi:uncharacterized protein YbjT (DUF2867 family)